MATAPTPAAFLVQFPEFTGADTVLISAKIADAVRRTDETVWGSNWVMGVMYRAAHLLAMSPMGRKMRLATDEGQSVYKQELDTLVRRVSSGFRVT